MSNLTEYPSHHSFENTNAMRPLGAFLKAKIYKLNKVVDGL